MRDHPPGRSVGHELGQQVEERTLAVAWGGLGYADFGWTVLYRGWWDEPARLKSTGDGMTVTYVTGALRVDVRRLTSDILTERGSLTNTGQETLQCEGPRVLPR